MYIHCTWSLWGLGQKRFWLIKLRLVRLVQGPPPQVGFRKWGKGGEGVRFNMGGIMILTTAIIGRCIEANQGPLDPTAPTYASVLPAMPREEADIASLF